MTSTLGSSSAIFASNIASLGANVAFLGKIGKDKFGEVILRELQKKEVNVSMIRVDGQLNTGATVVLAVEEDRANITYPGAMNHLTIADISVDALKKSKTSPFFVLFLATGNNK